MRNLLFTLIFTLVLVIPDFIANIFWKDFYLINEKTTLKEIIIILIISGVLSFLPKKSKIFFSFIFLLFTFGSIGYYFYFHTYLQPAQLFLLFSEYKDILLALKDMVFIILLFVFVIFLIIYLTSKIKTKTYKYSYLLFVFLLVVFPFFVAKKPFNYIPKATHFSFFNSLYGVDLFLVNLFKTTDNQKFKPYKIAKSKPTKQTIIVIMGESLNYKRMHLFRWDLNNTPYLDKLKEDADFIYKPAISGGVNTPVSLVTFFNIKREPTNVDLLVSQKFNLLNLAKQNGYKTYWFSMQEEGGSILSITNFADYKKEKKDYPIKFDDYLINDLKKIDFSKKNFIVLHFRANHYPYEKYTPKNFYKWNFNYEDIHKSRYYAYMDSVLYVDYLLGEIINYMKNNHKNFSIYFTSDHGEMLGFKDEKGKYGHSQLTIEDALVPFIYYSDNPLKLDKKIYNHYLIGKVIASEIGYKIMNPNENGEFFINNVRIDGSFGFIKYNLKDIHE